MLEKKGIKLLVKIVYVFLIIGLFYPASAQDLKLETTVDKTTIGLDQNFTLTINISGAKANFINDPQVPDLGDFAVYMGSSGTNQNIQMTGGTVSITKSHSYIFRAVTLGKFTIPPVLVKYKGKDYKSSPIQVEIVKVAQQQKTRQAPSTQNQTSNAVTKENLFLKAEVSKRNIYVNEPLVISFKIYTKVSVTQYGITKLPNTSGFWVEEYEIGNQPQVTEQVLNGQKYRVAEIKRMTLFPTDAGKKTIGPMEIECNVRVQTRRRSIFDSFFDDPFFGRSVRELVNSKPITINVKPLPEMATPKKFSGLVGRFEISSFIDKTQVKANEAIALMIEIAGSGNVKMIPEPKIKLPNDFEQYPPKVTSKINRNLNGVSGSKVYEYVLVPRHPGLQKIKPVELVYFDLKKKQYRTLRTKEIVVNVEKSDDDFTVFAGGRSKEDVKYLGKDIRFIQLGKPQFDRIASHFYTSFYFVILLLIPVAAVISAWFYRRHLNKLSGNIAYARSRKANQIAMKRLSKANKLLNERTQKEYYAEIANALMGFLGDKLNISAAGIITDEVEDLMKEKNVSVDVIEKYISCLQTCDYQRFAPSSGGFVEMKTFFGEAKQAIISLEKVI